MQQKTDFLSYSHFEYQAHQLKKRQGGQLDHQAEASFVSKLDKLDVEQIMVFLGEGLDVLLTHVSPVMIPAADVLGRFGEVGVGDLVVLDGLEKMQAYIQKNDNTQPQIIFLSIFNMPYLTYKPYLLKLLSILTPTHRLILYCNKIQSENAQKIITKANANTGRNFIQTQLDIPTPFDYIVSENLLDILEKFLYDQAKQTVKRDVVIFHDPTQQFKKKLFYLTKTKGFHLNTQIIYASSNQPPQKQLTKIFIHPNTSSLLKSTHDLSSVYLVLDYEQDTYNYFDYQRMCYVEVRGKFSYEEKGRRLGINLGNIGEYACWGKNQDRGYVEGEEERRYWDYGEYCLRMVGVGLGGVVAEEAKEIVEIGHCLTAFKNKGIIKDGQVVNKQILRLCSLGVNPIFANSILTSLTSPNKCHLLLLTHSILTCPQLRNLAQPRPSSIWHKTGYLQSCLHILIRYLQLQNLNSDLVSLDDIALNFQLNLDSFMAIWKEYGRLCRIFGVEELRGKGKEGKEGKDTINWDGFEEEEEFSQLIEELIGVFKEAVGTFSGSRRLGYLFKGVNKGYLAHRQSLISYFNQKPNFILITKMLIDAQNERPQILTCNYVRDDILISSFGCLPTLSKQSFGECQIQFHNISSAVFSHLSKFNGLQMQIFENQNQCSVEANSELNVITIQCSKEKQKQINEKFTKVLKDIEDMFKKQTKYFKQSNLLRVIMAAGGQICELMTIQSGKGNEIMQMAVVKNLAPQVGLTQLKQLFDEFIQLKDIKMAENTQKNEAIVTFTSAQDFRKFYQYFSGCVYYNYAMIIHPYVYEEREIEEESYLLFQWNVWKSVGEALIQLETTQAAKAALGNVRSLAGAHARVQQRGNMIFAEGLDVQVDEKDIASWVSGNGPILNIQIRRYTPTKQQQSQPSLKSIINTAFKQDILCTPQKIQKSKNGHRSCKVTVHNKQTMNEIYFALNQVKGILGNGKLNVTPVFTYPVHLPEPTQGYQRVYRDILRDFSAYLGRFQGLDMDMVKNPLRWTMIVKSNSEDQMLIIKNSLPERLKAVPLNINLKDCSILFTDLALKNFQKLEKKLPVKIIPDIIEKRIKVLCKPSTVSLLQKQVNTQIMQSFIFQIPLYEKAYHFLHKKLQQILPEQLKNGLKYRFEPINKNLHLEGNLYLLQKTREKINKSLAQFKQKIQEDNGMGENMCGLCCEEFKHPFKLQGCGHVFCFDCLENSIKFVIQDITLYPIKCPQCMQKIWISDLNCILQKKQWDQIIKISINHFIYTHPGQYIFCMTAGCTYICDIKYKSSYNCPECKKGYCLHCKNLIHTGMSCHEARYGSDRLFHDYMSAVGGRVCANKSCKSPIQRISGCFKVQCSRCKKCMCFKCPPNSMTPYDTPEETYNHMNRAHGGCF